MAGCRERPTCVPEDCEFLGVLLEHDLDHAAPIYDAPLAPLSIRQRPPLETAA
jgi:hypothetical protein